MELLFGQLALNSGLAKCFGTKTGTDSWALVQMSNHSSLENLLYKHTGWVQMMKRCGTVGIVFFFFHSLSKNHKVLCIITSCHDVMTRREREKEIEMRGASSNIVRL